MRTFAFLIAFASGLALAQSAPPTQGNALPDSTQCQMKCAQEMEKCMAPCMPKGNSDLEKPGAKNNMAGCTKKCATSQMPCMQKCNSPKNKKGGKEGDQ